MDDDDDDDDHTHDHDDDDDLIRRRRQPLLCQNMWALIITTISVTSFGNFTAIQYRLYLENTYNLR